MRLLNIILNLKQIRTRPYWTTREQQKSLAMLIAVAAEQQVPLQPLLTAWADDEQGVQQNRVRRLGRLLDEGAPLVDAVARIPGILGDQEILAVRCIVSLNVIDLKKEYPRVQILKTDGANEKKSQHSFVRWGALAYAAVVTVLFVPVASFLLLSIMPKYEKIIEDFGMERSPAMVWYLHMGDVIAGAWWAIAVAMVLLLWVAFFPRPRRSLCRSCIGRILRIHGDICSGEVLTVMAACDSGGKPVEETVAALAQWHYESGLRRKLRVVQNEIKRGTHLWQSMFQRGLLTSNEQHLLTESQDHENRPWILRCLAQSRRRRVNYKLEAMAEILMPILVSIMGIFVLLQSLAVVMPLQQLIMGLL